MSSLSQSALRHIDLLEKLAAELYRDDIAILEHAYYALAFGSFTLVFGRPTKRLKFSWDGKEFFLDIHAAEGGSSAVIPSWRHRGNRCLGPVGQEELFRVIGEITKKEFVL